MPFLTAASSLVHWLGRRTAAPYCFLRRLSFSERLRRSMAGCRGTAGVSRVSGWRGTSEVRRGSGPHEAADTEADQQFTPELGAVVKIQSHISKLYRTCFHVCWEWESTYIYKSSYIVRLAIRGGLLLMTRDFIK